jgi:ribosome-associated translation inhibitor RaiA
MNKQITFRNMEKSENIESYALQQLFKIEEFLKSERSPIHIEFIFEPSKVHEHNRVELRIKTPRFDEIVDYEHKGVAFYQALDRVIDIMYLRLREANKREKRDERKTRGRKEEFKKQR